MPTASICFVALLIVDAQIRSHLPVEVTISLCVTLCLLISVLRLSFSLRFVLCIFLHVSFRLILLNTARRATVWMEPICRIACDRTIVWRMLSTNNPARTRWLVSRNHSNRPGSGATEVLDHYSK